MLDIKNSSRYIVQLKKQGEEQHLQCATFCRKIKTYMYLSLHNHQEIMEGDPRNEGHYQ